MMRHKMSIQSKEFKVNCIELELIIICKISLSCFDDKSQ